MLYKFGEVLTMLFHLAVIKSFMSSNEFSNDSLNIAALVSLHEWNAEIAKFICSSRGL